MSVNDWRHPVITGIHWMLKGAPTSVRPQGNPASEGSSGFTIPGRDRLEGSAFPSVFDRTGQGFIRLMGLIPLVNRLPLDRLNPRTVSFVALVIVLAGSLTAFAFAGMSGMETPLAEEPVAEAKQVSEEPPEPAMLHPAA